MQSFISQNIKYKNRMALFDLYTTLIRPQVEYRVQFKSQYTNYNTFETGGGIYKDFARAL